MRARALRVVTAVASLALLAACAGDDEAGTRASVASTSEPATSEASTTEPVTVPATEPATAPPTEPTTVAPTQPVTEPTTTAPPGPPTIPPRGATRILVLNAGFKDGGAGATADGLTAIGYQVLTPQNALEDRGESAVYFREGWEAAAREVAGFAGIPQELVAPLPGVALADPQPEGFDIAVLLGRDRR